MQASLLPILEKIQNSDNPAEYFALAMDVGHEIIIALKVGSPIDREDLKEIRAAVDIGYAQNQDKSYQQFERGLGQSLFHTWHSKPLEGAKTPDAIAEFTSYMVDMKPSIRAQLHSYKTTILELAVRAQNRRAVLLMLQAGIGDEPGVLEQALKRAESAPNQSSNITGLLKIYQRSPGRLPASERGAILT
jgi:hypothetical protein